MFVHRMNFTQTVAKVKGDGNERGDKIEVDARKGEEICGREGENDRKEHDGGEGRGKTEDGMETSRGETEMNISEGSREREQVCRRGTERENEKRGSEREWQNGDCRLVTEGDKVYVRGVTEREREMQKDWKEDMQAENGEVKKGMEMVVMKYKTKGYPEVRRKETEERSDGAVETERRSEAGHEQPTAGVNLQHNEAGG